MLNEAESPTKPSDLPKTLAEMLKRREEVEAKRKAERAAKGGASANVERRR